MPSDYKRISAEYVVDPNLVGDFLSHMYSDKTHFVYELLMNAEDVGATRAVFRLYDDRLEFSHNGRRFSKANVKAICAILEGTKADDEETIGRFGVGFKSVYAYTSQPQIHSGDEHFEIISYVRPQAVAARKLSPGETLFVLPFKNPKVAKSDIYTRLQNLGLDSILFLSSLRSVSWEHNDIPQGTYTRRTREYNGVSCQVSMEYREANRVERRDWLLFRKRLSTSRTKSKVFLGVAFQVERSSIIKTVHTPLYVYFPTKMETHLGFLVHGPYFPIPARNSIAEDDPRNQKMIQETADFIVEVLSDLKNRGKLTASVLECLPIQKEYFGDGSPFAPLFSAVRRALINRALLPTHDGKYTRGKSAALAESSDMASLFSAEQIRHLAGHTENLYWLPTSITERSKSLLWRYLRYELRIPEFQMSTLARQMDAGFFGNQSDEWMCDFYVRLTGLESLWRTGQRPLRNRPFIRLEDGNHTPPYNGTQPLAYIAGRSATSYPTVKRSISVNRKALKFLRALGLGEPDRVAEVITHILPGYGGAGCLADDYEGDLRKIVAALHSATDSQKSDLLRHLRETPFLRCEDACSGALHYLRPVQAYKRHPDLEMYFAGNDEFGFLDKFAARYADTLSVLGVGCSVRMWFRAPNWPSPHVTIMSESWNHVRGLDGFDPKFTIDGLEHALSKPEMGRAIFIWNELLQGKAHLIRGQIESSTNQGFHNSSKEERVSPAGALLRDVAWLPDRTGGFHRPDEIGLDDLPEGYRRDERLATQLGMLASATQEAAEVLNVEVDEISLIRRYPERFRKFIEGLKQDDIAPAESPNSDPPESAEDCTVVKHTRLPNADDGTPTRHATYANPAGSQSAASASGNASGQEAGSGGNGGLTPRSHAQSPADGSEETNARNQRGWRSYAVLTTQADSSNPESDASEKGKQKLAVAKAGVERVLEIERKEKRNPREMTHPNRGYDIKSQPAFSQDVRYIEVKSCTSEWDVIELTRDEFEAALEKGDSYWLYVVENVYRDDSTVTRIQNPAAYADRFLFEDCWRTLGEVCAQAESSDCTNANATGVDSPE